MKDAIEHLNRGLMLLGVETLPEDMNAKDLVVRLQALNACGPDHYNCPIRRDQQWTWNDRHEDSDGCTCIECGEKIAAGERCVKVSCHNKGILEEGTRCNFCHKISLDYCSPLGQLRETFRNKTGMDYLTGEEDG
jgi:predicted RNA-binding Zn-ribbon protein involved in translation (DUF1610 family)